MEVIGYGTCWSGSHECDAIESFGELLILFMILLLFDIQFLEDILQSEYSIGILLDDIILSLFDVIIEIPNVEILFISNY